jgi:hypothetical protein
VRWHIWSSSFENGKSLKPNSGQTVKNAHQLFPDSLLGWLGVVARYELPPQYTRSVVIDVLLDWAGFSLENIKHIALRERRVHLTGPRVWTRGCLAFLSRLNILGLQRVRGDIVGCATWVELGNCWNAVYSVVVL